MIIYDLFQGLFRQFYQVFTVFGLFEFLVQAAVNCPDEIHPLPPGYLFDTTDIKALTVLNGSHKVRGFEQTVAVPGIQPCKSTSEQFHVQCSFFEIQAGSSPLFHILHGPKGGRASRFFRHGSVVEIKSGNGIIAFRHQQAFLPDEINLCHCPSNSTTP